jgi:hypothetical protein
MMLALLSFCCKSFVLTSLLTVDRRLSISLFGLQVGHTRSIEQFPRVSPFRGSKCNHKPEKDHYDAEYLHQRVTDRTLLVGRGVLTIPKILKNREGISTPNVIVLTAYTPRGNVKPHQPMLKGNGLHL